VPSSPEPRKLQVRENKRFNDSNFTLQTNYIVPDFWENLVIFDIDGTLCDSNAVDTRCFAKAFQQVFDVPIEDTDWDHYETVTDAGITEALVQHHFQRAPTLEESQRFQDCFAGLLRDEREQNPGAFAEVPGARAMYNRLLKARQFVLGIATGAWPDSAMVKLKTMGLDIRNVWFSHSGRYQTKAEILNDVIRQATGRFSVHIEKFKRIVYLGDRPYDYRAAQKAGIGFIGVDVEQSGRLKQEGVPHVLTDFTRQEDFFNLIAKM